jgi:hypothetical protein
MILQPGRAVSPDYSPPNFCDGCGAPHPWASRLARLYELENLLDEGDIDDADRLVVTEHLRRLQELDPDDDRDQQTRLWYAIKRRAPGLFEGAGNLITKTLIDMAMRRALKLGD